MSSMKLLGAKKITGKVSSRIFQMILYSSICWKGSHKMVNGKTDEPAIFLRVYQRYESWVGIAIILSPF